MALTEHQQVYGVASDVCIIPQKTGIISGVGQSHCSGIDGLVGALWIQDKVGDIARPWVSAAVFVPEEKNLVQNLKSQKAT